MTKRGFGTQSPGGDGVRQQRNAQEMMLPQNFGAGLIFDKEGRLALEIPIDGSHLKVEAPLKVVGGALTVDMDTLTKLVDDATGADLHKETHWENGTDELVVEKLASDSAATSGQGWISDGSRGVNRTTGDMVTKIGAIPTDGVLVTDSGGEEWRSVPVNRLVGHTTASTEVNAIGASGLRAHFGVTEVNASAPADPPTGMAWLDTDEPASLGPDAVQGPASATDEALVRFDGTSGKLIQDSGVLIDDSGNITPTASAQRITGFGTLEVQAGAPSTPVTGMGWLDTDEVAASALAVAQVGTSTPVAPPTGLIWLDTN